MFRFDLDEDSRSVAELAREFGKSVQDAERRTDAEGSVPEEVRRQAEETGLLDLGRPESAGGLGLSIFVEGHATAALVEEAPTIGTALLWPEAAGLFGAERGVRLVDGGGGALGYRRVAELRAEGPQVTGQVGLAPSGGNGYYAVARRGGEDRLYRVGGAEATPYRPMGQRAMGLGRLSFDAAGEDLGPFLAHERALLMLRAAPFFHGYGRAALRYARDYAAQRQAFGKFIGAFQGVAFLLADVAMELEAAELLWQDAATSPDDAPKALRLAADALRSGKDAAWFAANSCVGILGGHGFVDDHPAERWLRDVETLSQLAGNSAALRQAGLSLDETQTEVEGIA